MTRIFADTHYWGAILHPGDQYAARARRIHNTIADFQLVTTDEVLTELLDGLARRGRHIREAGVVAVRKILSDPRVVVCPQSRESFTAGVELYERRLDKGYSLVDCISMMTMRRERIGSILTNDNHFCQEGYSILL